MINNAHTVYFRIDSSIASVSALEYQDKILLENWILFRRVTICLNENEHLVAKEVAIYLDISWINPVCAGQYL